MKRKEQLFLTPVFFMPLCPPPFSHHTAVLIDWGFYTSVASVFDWHSHMWGSDHEHLWPRCYDSSAEESEVVITKLWLAGSTQEMELIRTKVCFFFFFRLAVILLHSHTHTPLSYRPTFTWNTSVLFIKHVWKIKELNYASSLVKTVLWLWIRNEWIIANTHCISEMTHSESWII